MVVLPTVRKAGQSVLELPRLGGLLSKAKYTIFRTRKGEDVDTGISIGAGYFAVAYVSEDKPNWSMSDIWKVTKNSTEFKSVIEKVVQSANDVNAKRGNDVDYVSKIVVTQNTWENADMAIMQLVQ